MKDLHMQQERSSESPLAKLEPYWIALINTLIIGHSLLLFGYWGLWLLGSRTNVVLSLSYVAPWLFVPVVVLLPVAVLRRSRLLIGVEAACALLFLLPYGEYFLPNPPVDAPGDSLTVMTHNIHWSNTNLDEVAGQIKAASPDIIGLQELSPEMFAVLEPQLAALYPYHHTTTNCGLFSRYPLKDCKEVRYAIPEGFTYNFWSQVCEVDIDSRRITIFNVHTRSPYLESRSVGPLKLPTKLNTERHDPDVESVLEGVRDARTPVLAMGDFNFSPQHDWYREFRSELEDAYRERGWGLGFSYSRDFGTRVAVWRLDYLFHSPDIVALDARMGDYAGSDHRAVVATFGLPESVGTPER